MPARRHWTGGAQAKAVPPQVPPVHFFFIVPASTEIYALSLHVAPPILLCSPIVLGLPSSRRGPSGSRPLPVHAPVWQLSPFVQPLPSLQAVPSDLVA